MIAARAKRRCSAKTRRGASAPVFTAGLGLVGWIASAGVHATVLALLAAWGEPAPRPPATGAITVELVVAEGAESPGNEAQEPADHVPDVAGAPAAPAKAVALPEPSPEPAPAAPADRREPAVEPAPTLLALVPPPRKPPVPAPPAIAPPPAAAPAAPLSPAGHIMSTSGDNGPGRSDGAPAVPATAVSLAGAVGRAAAAPSADNPKPAYPAYARRRGIEGRVVLRVEVTAEGGAGAVAVVESSGHDSLDEAAVTAVRRWRFHPAVRDGVPVPSTLRVPITFRLTE